MVRSKPIFGNGATGLFSVFVGDPVPVIGAVGAVVAAGEASNIAKSCSASIGAGGADGMGSGSTTGALFALS
jgi:hypothetical protein